MLQALEQWSEVGLENIGLIVALAGLATTFLLIRAEEKEKYELKEIWTQNSQRALVYWLNWQILFIIFGGSILLIMHQKDQEPINLAIIYATCTAAGLNYWQIHQGYNFYLYCFEMEEEDFDLE